ncbi:MAG TPA: hypothetical protein VMN04_11195 [Thermoanaerobaculia bacterium]|nr:hypothetical protein [Thermoanaerobaculia bacterium]
MRAAARAAALAFTLALGPGLAAEDALSVRLETGGQEWVSRRSAIEIVPSRPVRAAEGRLAIQIGKADVTDLFEPSDAGLRYRARVRPLPTGEQTVAVFLVTPAGEWKEIAKLPLKVLRPGGFEKVEVAPKLDLTLKGQIGEGHFPDSSAPARTTFQDLTGQATLSATASRGANAITAQMALALAQREEDALQFSSKGQEAGHADLSSWGMKVAFGPGTLEWGGISFGENRHLVNGFSSRGGRFTLALGRIFDVAVAAANGTSIVGWDNFSGLDTREHQVRTGRLGIELVPSAPGTLRVETTLVDGSLLTNSAVNRSFVTDTERSRGLGVRALASLLAGRLRLEGGFARSRFESPPDPSLEQGQKVVPIAPTTRSASFATLAADVVKGSGPFALSVNVSHERVDPQYRSVGVSTQSDLQTDSAQLTATLAGAQLQGGYAWTRDNLADLPNLLTTKTARPTASVNVPLGTLVGGAAPVWWLPALTYGWNQAHQFGANNPTGGGFNPSQIPDQVTTSHAGTADWQKGVARWGYHLSDSLVDNRQPGRENADSRNLVQSLLLGAGLTAVDVSAQGDLERAANIETGSVDLTKRVQLTLGLRPFTNATLSANGTRTATGDEAGTRDGLAWGANLEASWRFEPPKRGTHGVSGQVSLRYGFTQTRTRDLVQSTGTFQKTWTVGSGLSLSVF